MEIDNVSLLWCGVHVKPDLPDLSPVILTCRSARVKGIKNVLEFTRVLMDIDILTR